MAFLFEQILCLCSKVVFYVFQVIHSKLKNDLRILTFRLFQLNSNRKVSSSISKLRCKTWENNCRNQGSSDTSLYSRQHETNKGKCGKLPLYNHILFAIRTKAIHYVVQPSVVQIQIKCLLGNGSVVSGHNGKVALAATQTGKFFSCSQVK